MRNQARWIAAFAMASIASLGTFAPSALARNAYVANLGSASVSVLDTETNAAVGAIPVGNSPTAIAITPDGSRAYVANQMSNTVSVIDLRTSATMATVPIGPGPSAIALTPDGSRAYVVIRNSNSVSVIDTRTNTVVVPAISVGSFPQAIAITPNGARAYVSNDLPDNTVSVIDTSTNTTVGLPIPVANRPGATAITPDGARAYVTRFAAASVAVIDTQSNVVVGTIPVGSGPADIVITPDGTRAYVPSLFASSVSVIDLHTNTVMPPIPVGTNPRGIAITPDGSRAYVAKGPGPNTVSVIDTATNSAVGEVGVGTGPIRIAITPDQPPKASLVTRAKGLTVTFKGGASSDPDGKIATYSWDFGDGKQAQTTAPTIKHTYKKVLKYAARLTVSDGEGCKGVVFTGQTASCNGPSLASASRLLAAVKILKLKRNKDNGTATLRVRVPGKVTVKLSGKGVVRQRPAARASGLARFKQGLGTVSLRIKAKGRAKRKLNRGGKVRLKVKVTVRPIGGDPNVQGKRVKLVKRG
jgi:YVTN family beta-propeller protein